jgi:UDPglucose 6-dehydrogenase
MNVGVIGTGHVGLVTCVSLASFGHRVIGTDQDAEKIATLRAERVPFHEPGLDALLHDGVSAGRLSFTTDPEEAIEDAEAVFISVGTPPRASGEANLAAVERAARTVARHAGGDCVVIEKSTVPTGTAQRLSLTLRRERRHGARDLEIVSNPEFLREGSALQDSLQPDRILVGAESEWGFNAMRRLYAPLVDQGTLLIETDIATAELAKHACNAFLALKVSFANALARICERAGADVVSVVDVMGADTRIGRAYLDAGLGYGGSCFTKDLRAFDRLSSGLGYDFALLREIAKLNRQAVLAAFEKVKEALWNLEGKRVALLGLAFKPGTDDVRFSPGLELASMLLEEGTEVAGYDPEAAANSKAEVPELLISSSPYDAVSGAHCAVICTEWDEIRSLDWATVSELMTYPIVVDGRNIADPDLMAELGFSYLPMGRPAVL